MINVDHPRLVLHASVIVLLALSCGLPSVVEVSEGTTRMWQAAHSALLLMGVWMFAEAGVLGVIRLNDTERTVLVWSLITTSYSLAFAAVVQAVTGARSLGPTTSVVGMSVFVANLIVVLGSVLSVSITLLGAKKAIADLHAVPNHGTAESSFQSPSPSNIG